MKHSPEQETWKPVPGYENSYEASSLGRIRRCWYLQVIGRSKTNSGYWTVKLAGKAFYVHRLIALTFLGPCPSRYEVNHKDGDKENNRAANLEYTTRLLNVRHHYRMKRRIQQGFKVVVKPRIEWVTKAQTRR